MVKMMIPLTGRNTQHSSFTWALQPSSSAQASTHAFEGWPGASELAADSLHLPSNLPHPSLNDIPLPQQQHDPTSAGQQANVTDIFASEQTEDLLFTNYLSDLSVFDAIDFDDMLAYAISDNAPPIIQQQQHQHHQQQPQQHHQQQHSDSQAGVNKWIASHPDRTSSPSSASIVLQPASPIVASLQKMQPSKPPSAALRKRHVARPDNAMFKDRQLSQALRAQVSSEAKPADCADYEPERFSRPRGPRSSNRKVCIKTSKAVKAKHVSQAKQYSTRAGLKLASQNVMTRLDGNTTPDLAKQQSCSSQDQCSIRLTHISQQTQQSEKQGFAGSGAALAEGSKLLLASVHNKCAQQTSLTKAGLQGGQAAHVTGMAPADSQQLKQRLRSALAAASTALAPEESAAAATTSAAADKVARFSRAEASDNLRAAKKATAACQAAAVTSEAKLLHLAGPQQPAMMATATQTSNSPDRSDTPETASSAADLKDAKEQKPCNAANKATQTQPEKVAMLAVGTQTHDVVPIAAAKQSPISKSHTQPQAELDAAQTLSQLAAGATASQSPNQCSPFATTRLNSPRSTAAGPQSSKHHNSDASTRQVSPITVPRLSSPKRTPTAKTVPSLPHVTPHRSRQSCLSPDARDKTAGVESPRAQHVNSSQVIHASPSKAKSSMRTFRGRGVQPAAHDDSDDHLAATPIQQQRSHKDSNTGKGIALPRTPETVCNAPLVASSPAAEVKPLLADIMGTTGCRVTRRLVHSVLAAATAPTKPSSKERSAAPAPRSATAFRVAAAPLAKKHGRPPRKPSQLQSDEVCNQETDLRTPTYSTDSMQQTACKAQNSNSAKLHEVTHPAGLQALGGMIQKHPPSTALLAAETPTAAASGGMASNCVGGLVAPDNIACLADSPSQQGVHQTTPHAAANDRHLATPNTSERHSRREQHAGASERPDLKRDLADAAERPELPKKPKAQCLTAAGLNPKFLATKDEVLRLIGDRQDVLEGELRRRMGNNPDTSKALRKLHKEGALNRSGAGGRSDPFKWTKRMKAESDGDAQI